MRTAYRMMSTDTLKSDSPTSQTEPVSSASAPSSSASTARSTVSGERTSSFRSIPNGDASRFWCGVGTIVGATPTSSSARYRPGSNSTESKIDRSLRDCNLCRRSSLAKKVSTSGSRMYGTVRYEMSSSESCWPSTCCRCACEDAALPPPLPRDALEPDADPDPEPCPPPLDDDEAGGSSSNPGRLGR